MRLGDTTHPIGVTAAGVPVWQIHLGRLSKDGWSANRRPLVTAKVVEKGSTMAKSNPQSELQRLTTPRAAGIAGIIFSVLFCASIVLLRTSLPRPGVAVTGWAHQDGRRVGVA